MESESSDRSGGLTWESADLWRSVIEGADVGILVIDSAGVVRYANAAASRLLDRPVEDLAGKPFGIPVVSGTRTELEIPTAHGPRACDVSVATANAGGSELVVSLRDASQRRRIAQEQERTMRQAEAVVRAKNALLDGVAHELRVPLTVVSGYLSMIAAGDLGPVPKDWTEPLGHIREATDQLSEMVEKMLTTARIEAGRVEQQRDVVDLREVVNHALARIRSRARRLHANVTLEAPGDPVMVEIDQVQVGIILDNLIGNAIKYSDAPARIEISVSAGQGEAAVRVSDHGMGIEPEQQAAVFERFQRLPAASFGSRSGAGLGLAIARDFAELNGGSLEVEWSRLGEGSRFLLTLPTGRAKDARES